MIEDTFLKFRRLLEDKNLTFEDRHALLGILSLTTEKDWLETRELLRNNPKLVGQILEIHKLKRKAIANHDEFAWSYILNEERKLLTELEVQ